MLRRLLPTLAALVCGLLALFWGLVSLQRIFTQEREDALAQLRTSRDALEEYASQGLRHRLAERLRSELPTLSAAGGNPLVPGQGFYLRFRGQQILPRTLRLAPGTDTPARRHYRALVHALASGPMSEPWRERLSRLRDVEGALDQQQFPRANALVDELLRQCARQEFPPEQELPFLLLLLERLQRGAATPPLVRALLREGLPEDFGGIQRSMGLQRDLLLKREFLTAPDFGFLLARTVKVSRALGEPVEDFLSRAREADTSTLFVPEGLTGPVLIGERWYVAPSLLGTPPEPGMMGLAVELAPLLDELTRELRERGHLGPDGRVQLTSDPSNSVLALSTLRLEVSVPQWRAAEAAIEQRHGLKTLLVATCGALAVAIGVLALVAQRGRYRYVELKNDFVATVSHELRTPLASIRLMAETLERKLAQAPPDTRAYPERILQAADGLGFLVENILSFNRIDKGRWRPRISLVALEELVGMLRSDLRDSVSVPVRLTADVGEAQIQADPSLIRLLLANLARNACAYNRRSPVELSLRAYPSGQNGCVVMFSDNGIGIPPGEWENVFRDFHRLESNGPEVHGSGLGLALCRKIMTLHGGRITVENSSPEGTTFCLLFPESRT